MRTENILYPALPLIVLAALLAGARLQSQNTAQANLLPSIERSTVTQPKPNKKMSQTPVLQISSQAFQSNGDIPDKYSCNGENINPPIQIDGIPHACQTLAMIIDDPDAPHGTFTHWLVWNIPPQRSIEENSTPGLSGKNSAGTHGYTGPCPPAGSKHHYHFKLYALDTKLDLPGSSDKAAFENAIKGHVLAQGELVALYSK